ncbi:DCN1-like protein 5 [Coemansia sp. RSA 485]|nr:DCN1-like protein 5 [Coemansia sp. RSA 485]
MPRSKAADKRQAKDTTDVSGPAAKRPATRATKAKVNSKTKRAKNSKHTDSKTEAEPVDMSEELFAQYQDFERTDGKNMIGPEGFERLSTDLGYDMSRIEPLVLMWKLGCTEMGTVPYENWTQSLSSMGASNLDQLKKAVDSAVSKLESDQKVYKQFYRQMFDYLKTGKQKVISVDYAKDILPVIKGAKDTLFDRFVAFLDANSEKIKTINRDQWQSLLELSRSMDDSLSGYSKEDAWPAMFDDFAEWVQNQK